MQPISDETMTYDTDEQRYILTPAYVMSKTGINLSKVLNPAFSTQPQMLAQQFLNEISAEVYGFIFEHNADNQVQQYLLDTNEFLRKTLRSAMLEQVLYTLRNGDLNQYSGVNLKNGQILPQSDFVGAFIAPNAKRALNRVIPGVGVAITYQGTWQIPLSYFDKKGE